MAIKVLCHNKNTYNILDKSKILNNVSIGAVKYTTS